MKLLFPSTFLALALLQTQTSTAFSPIRHGQQINNRLSTNLNMVGFKDPRQKENRDAIRALQILNTETKNVKKWLADLMEPDEEDEASETTVKSSAGDVGLFGGSAMATSTSPTVNLPSYKPTLRSDLGKSILLTGTYHPSLLRALNNNDFGSRDSEGGGESGDLIPNFQFERIILSVHGEEAAKEAKKRVISREARYSGLLNKVVIEAEETLLPVKERLEGVSSWIVRLDAGETAEMLPQVAELASGVAELKNVIVIVEGVDSMAGTVEGWDGLLQSGGNFKPTLLAVGELYEEGPAGKFYHIGTFMGDDKSSIEFTNADAVAPKMLRSEAYLTLANLLALDVTSNKALGAYEYSPESIKTIHESIEDRKKILNQETKEIVDAPQNDEWKAVKYANRIVRAMRETGFSRLAELDVLLDKGVDAYLDFLEAPPKKRKTDGEDQSKWDKVDADIMAKLAKDTAEIEARREEEAEMKKKIAIKDMAYDWATQEYEMELVNGSITEDKYSKAEFFKKIWPRAMAEGEKLYKYVNTSTYKEKMKQRAKPREQKSDYFWKGMDPKEKKLREKILKRVTDQYLEAYAAGEEVDVLQLSEGGSSE
ncbi:hypothetical protein ACHAWO_001246 [Cyclotella atomus]|uniref:Uncharacterized protein n=1 Tax=Cyclotella atomus TaxID=382360 RepID=A0ABD3P6P9_9STRA